MIIKDRQPESSFLSVEKDANIIVDRIIKNKRLMKLLHYSTPNALEQPVPSKEEIYAMFGKNIKIVPKITVDSSVLSYIIISFDNFYVGDNPEYRNNVLTFDIICHFDQWPLGDFQLRPYKIAAEIDSMFNNQRLTGIGKVEFMGANQLILTDEFGGLTLMYEVIHGDEDKTPMPNPLEQEQFEADFKEMVESFSD